MNGESAGRGRLVVIAHTVVAPVADRWRIKNRVGVLLQELSELGWDVTVVARQTEPMPFMTHHLSPSVRVVTVPAGRRGHTLERYIRIARHLRTADAALVFMPSLMSAVLGVTLGRRAVVYAGASWELRGARRWRVALESLLARRALHVVTAGDAVAARFRKTGTPTTVCVPLVDPEIARRMREPHLEPKVYDELRLLYVGSLLPAKGTAELIDALRQLPTVLCRVVGPPGDATVSGLAKSMEALPNVTLHGYLEWTELRACYEWATALVLPSHSEGFPRVVYEATAFGLGSIVTPVGGIPHRLKDRRDAFVVPVGDSMALTDTLRSVSQQPHRLGEVAAAAHVALAPLFGDPSPGPQFDRTLRESVRAGSLSRRRFRFARRAPL